VRQRAEKDKALLETINDAKQLTNLQHELESLARRQAELEDVELEVMERLEAAQKSHSALLADRDTVAADLAEATVALANALADLADEEGIAAAARTAAAERVPADLLGLYDKLRADNAGIGCRIELTPVDLGRIREAPPAEVIRCEECRRILVRTAESGL
jgi:predicted  nucleic acid-binding Zn-ribbon protein